MKFGKQLQLGTYEPWKDYYIQYSKLKRIIKRRKFVADKHKENLRQNQFDSAGYGTSRNSSPPIQMVELTERSSSKTFANEYTPLTSQVSDRISEAMQPPIASSLLGGALVGGPDFNDDSLDFFKVICEEMNKINNFFIGKLAELRILLEEITRTRRNVYRIHHTGGEPSYLLRLRDIYVELAALRSFAELNKTGFYKIIKKYDKTMVENTLEVWMPTVEIQQFATSGEPLQLMEDVTNLVSRDKLIEWERFATEQQNKSNDDIFPAVRLFGVLISLLVFALSLIVNLITPNDPVASRCMALLLLVICLWVTEAIPYFATALLIPALVVILGVLKDPKDPTKSMSPELAASFVLNHIFNHTTMLLLGGYTISSAFSRCQLELRFASWLQGKLGSRPLVFILAVMFLGLFLSMWINNHTAPILCATVILPIVRDLPTDSKFSKALLLGLAYACNFGGMMTPISSLQNVLAVSYLEQSGFSISFGRWICVSLPFCVLCTILSWLLVILVINPNDVKSVPVIVYERDRHIGRRDTAIIVLSLLTIILFASFYYFKNIFGDIGILSLCFVSVMFGTGMLSEVDFNSLSWHTLFLVGGGNVLGKAVESSGLLGYLSDGITRGLPLSNPWLALVFILIFTTGVATFVSHTVAALILMPIISTIGISLEIPEIVVIGAAFSISAAMALPFSSFPNVNSLLIVDDFQRAYLGVKEFAVTGFPISMITVFLIATVGFLLIDVIVVSHN